MPTDQSVCYRHLGKYEKLLMNRLRHHLSITNYLSNDQYGFRSGRSTLHALLRVKVRLG
ncbi:hypothetical protein X975_14894, partial [Stegodyphus mimosarum]